MDNSVKDEQALDIDGDLTFFQAVGLMHYGFFCLKECKVAVNIQRLFILNTVVHL